MATHEKVLKEKLAPGQVKALCAAVVEGVPVELSRQVTDWWTTGSGRIHLLATSIKQLLNRPPVLKYVVKRWKAFYHQVFRMQVDFTVSKGDEMVEADNWIMVSPKLQYGDLIDHCRDLWPEFWPMSLPRLDQIKDLLKPGGATYRHESGKSYRIHVEPEALDGSYFKEDDEGSLTLKELLIQQIFRYWCGDLNNSAWDNRWHYAVGTRYCGGDALVPGTCWNGTELRCMMFRRSSIKPDQWCNQLCILD